MSAFYQIPMQPGQRWCTNCQQPRNTDGGQTRLMQNGTRSRWVCGSCAEARKRRLGELSQ